MRMAIINGVAASPLIPSRVRTVLLKMLGLRIPVQSRIFPGVVIRSLRFSMGEYSTINTGTVIDNHGADVSIGSRVGVGVGVRILCADHDFSNPLTRAGTSRFRPVVIEDGAWIGTNAVILPGVTVGAGAVIAAGAVVTKDVNPHTLWGGVPAKMIREL